METRIDTSQDREADTDPDRKIRIAAFEQPLSQKEFNAYIAWIERQQEGTIPI